MNKIINRVVVCLFVIVIGNNISAQHCYWQQKADYTMDIDFDVDKHQYKGKQTIVYTNNSPDDLHNLYYHLYFNAFQPNSMMDVRSRTISDPDPRVGERISVLNEDEIGYIKVKWIKVNGKKQKIHTEGTILEVDLKESIKTGETVTLEMKWDAQVPLQKRRSGRNKKEVIDYSMAQWYPKLAEYDYQGWHPNPYIGREFHGIWGDWDVNITIDSKYIIGATGELVNADDIGYGYAPEPAKKGKKLTWHWQAKNVIDFAWGADPDYTHDVYECYDGTVLHMLYQANEKTTENWKALPMIMDVAKKYMDRNYGKYVYPTYSFIQGGDGGMEYPMATLITGERTLSSLVGVSVHEWFHSWYQMMLGTDEARYPWMDEGFTSYGSAYTMNYLKKRELIPGDVVLNPMSRTIDRWTGFALSGYDEPLSTHADHYSTNAAYGAGSYSKGSIFLAQLKYIVGDEVFTEGMLKYFDDWAYKHPTPNDFIRVMEKVSGMKLDWYKEYMVYSTKYPDYGIDTVINKTVRLVNNGQMPMPLEVVVTTKKGKQEVYYIPLRIMRGEKRPSWPENVKYKVKEDWPWTHPTYDLEIDCKVKNIEKIEINPTIDFVDLNRLDNVYPKQVLEEKETEE